MGWLSQPLPAGGTFTDSVTGRTWTIGGSGLELWQVYQPEFLYEYDQYPYSGWVTPTPSNPALFSFRGTRQVQDWWKGPRAMNLQVQFLSDVQTPSLVMAAGTQIRVRVKVGTAAGGEETHTLFQGRISDVKTTLTPLGIPLAQVQIVGDMGFNSQTAFDPNIDLTSATSFDHINFIFANWMNTLHPLTFAPVSLDSGISGAFNTGTGSNVMNDVATLIRGELGMLWPAPDGGALYASGDWYVQRPSPVNAVLGTNLGAVAADYELPVSMSTPTVSLKNFYNNVKWTGPLGGSTSTQPANAAQYGDRFWSDNVYVNTAGNLSANTGRLSSVLAQSPSEKVEMVRFPSDLTIDSMQYAVRADVSDYVYVTQEWLPGKWSRQVDAHVIGVTHEWSQSQGWWTTLRVTEALDGYTFPTPGRVPGS